MRPHGVARFTSVQKLFQRVGNCFDIQRVNWAVDPEPSERTTGTIALFGMASPGLSAAIWGSFQLVIFPVKIFVIVSPPSRRLLTLLPPIFRLYMNDVPPATIGM